MFHNVYDTDAHFKIDPVTRAVKNDSSGKIAMIQNDHNSERFTFEIPRLVDGHDMSLCNQVEVHFINIDSADKNKTNTGVYPVVDLQISPESEDIVICSWLISKNATKYAGTLNFLLKFKCVGEDEIAYKWQSARYDGIPIYPSIDNGEDSFNEYAAILLKQWEDRLTALEEANFVKTVNGQTPDENGNVEIKTSGCDVLFIDFFMDDVGEIHEVEGNMSPADVIQFISHNTEKLIVARLTDEGNHYKFMPLVRYNFVDARFIGGSGDYSAYSIYVNMNMTHFEYSEV